MKIEMTLYRDDLLSRFKTTPIEDITYAKFKLDIKSFQKSTTVVFIDDDGRHRILKERFTHNLNL